MGTSFRFRVRHWVTHMRHCLLTEIIFPCLAFQGPITPLQMTDREAPTRTKPHKDQKQPLPAVMSVTPRMAPRLRDVRRGSITSEAWQYRGGITRWSTSPHLVQSEEGEPERRRGRRLHVQLTLQLQAQLRPRHPDLRSPADFRQAAAQDGQPLEGQPSGWCAPQHAVRHLQVTRRWRDAGDQVASASIISGTR